MLSEFVVPPTIATVIYAESIHESVIDAAHYSPTNASAGSTHWTENGPRACFRTWGRNSTANTYRFAACLFDVFLENEFDVRYVTHAVRWSFAT